MKLKDVPNGCIFLTESGIVAIKSEYHYSDGRTPMCILLASGEYAHFPYREHEPIKSFVNDGAILEMMEK